MTASQVAVSSRTSAPVLLVDFSHRLASLPRQYRERVQDYLEHLCNTPWPGVIEGDPWCLALNGIVPFEVLDMWLRDVGYDPTVSRARVPAAVMDTLRTALITDGHLAVRPEKLLPVVQLVLRDTVSPGFVVDTIIHLAKRGLLTEGFGRVQLPSAALLEARLVQRIAALVRSVPADGVVLEAMLRKRVARTKLDAEQCEVLLATARTRLTVVTGPAGSGKSLIISTLVQIYEEFGKRVLVGTPTGKAADVLQARGVLQASTCHRLLGITPEHTDLLREPPTDVPMLSGDVLLLDEGTMNDAVLFDRILQAVPDNMSVAVFGDADQLRPVGPGAVFEWLVAEAIRVPVVSLNAVHRTGGRLTKNALDIRSGRMPTLGDPTAAVPCLEDAWYDTAALPTIYREAARKALPAKATEIDVEHHAIALWVTELATSILPGAFNFDPGADIQVITPQGPGILGTTALSALIRNRVNPLAEGDRDGRVYYGDKTRVRAGDCVIAVNTISSTITNGMQGVVRRIDTAAKAVYVHVLGAAVPIRLTTAQMRNFVLRYALTVDRTQGSEYAIVLQIIHEATAVQLATRRRLYTGYTRARHASILIGSEARLRYSLDNTTSDFREGTFRDRLAQALGVS